MAGRKTGKRYRSNKVKSLPARVAKLTRRVNAVSSAIETKHLDSAATATSVSTTIQYHLLNGIAQGDDVVNRSGNYTIWKSINFKLIPVAGDSYNYIRCLIVHDSQTNLNAPTDVQLFQDSGTYNVISPLNWDNRKRFTVLFDKSIKVDTDDPSGISPMLFKHYIKIPKRLQKTFYGGSGGTVSAITKGSIYFVCFSDSTAATHPTLSWYFRATFQDA